LFRILKIVFLVLVIYALGYFCFRQSHIENWDYDKQDYVMFPAGQMWLYRTFTPAMHVDKQWTGMLFQIGPHPENIKKICPVAPLNERRRLYKNVEEVLHDKNGCFWVDPLYADSISLFVGVYFDRSDPNNIHFNYSHDCTIKFPCRLEKDGIAVLWNDVKNCELKLLGEKDDKNKPFFSLRLENDSTLKTTVINKKLVQKLNTFDKNRRLIPERFCILNIEM
jgi:hypothetical protein